ncbi:hypothetical protein [Luteimonas sp. A482]
MTNPHPTTPTAIDIRTSAERVIAEVRQGRLAQAVESLEQAREGQRTVVQEALDRYVAAGVRAELPGMGRDRGHHARHAQSVDRLAQALGPPRIPDYSHIADSPNELVGLTEAQKHAIYAGIVEVRGNDVARDDLRRDGHSVLLALRRETSTLASPGQGRTGTGLYDDQVVVLTRTANGEGRIFLTGRASTEPTAQYSHQAGSDGTRPFGDRDFERRQIAPAAGYEDVAWRRIQGDDVNGDTMRDLGRLAEGTIEMQIARHDNPAAARTDTAFRPSPEQLRPERIGGRVQRDTNGDGLFTVADLEGVQGLNNTFKIHSGSRNNTDSAGCQTIHPNDYSAFIDAAQSNPRQTRWQYVLTSTQGGLFHNVEVGGDRPQPAARPEAPAPVERPAGRQGSAPQPSGPFDDPGLNRYYAAVLAGDGATADRIALGFSFRAPELAVQSQDHLARLAAPNEAHVASAQREAPGLQM